MKSVFEAKLARLRGFMAGEGLGTLVLSRLDNVAWLGCGAKAQVALLADVAIASFVVTTDGVWLVANNIEAPRLRDEEVGELGVEVVAYNWHDGEPEAVIARLTAPDGRVAGDTPSPRRELVNLQPLRYALLPAEQTIYREVGRDVGAAIAEVARGVRPGDTEYQLAGRLTAALLERELWPQVVLVAADERARLYRHPLPTGRAVERYAMLVCSGKRRGLVAAVSRCVHLGPPPADLLARHDAVCRVDATLMAHTQPGAPVAGVLAAGIAAYGETGYPDEWRHHHQGGAAGYQARDYRATPGSEEVVHPGQAFAWNPTIAGAKSEDTILAVAGGPEILSGSPDWPLRRYTVAGRSLGRPEILVL